MGEHLRVVPALAAAFFQLFSANHRSNQLALAAVSPAAAACPAAADCPAAVAARVDRDWLDRACRRGCSRAGCGWSGI